MLLEQIKSVEVERDVLLAEEKTVQPTAQDVACGQREGRLQRCRVGGDPLIDREQGVSKAVNPRLCIQPRSVLAHWFRNGEGAKLAVSRNRQSSRSPAKLLVALWKYVNAGVVVIEGIVMKAARLQLPRVELFPILRTSSVLKDPGGPTELDHGLKSRREEWTRLS